MMWKPTRQQDKSEQNEVSKRRIPFNTKQDAR